MRMVLYSLCPIGCIPMLLGAVLVMIVSCRQKSDSPFSKSAEDALTTFELVPGFQIELVASEPLVADPVAMEIDENGHMYVVEMHGNPFDKSGTGNVKLLTDTNGDGRMDRSTVFADSLIMPSGITSWKKGVLVTDPPHVLYLEDSDGDGRADIRNIVLTGFDSTDLESNVNNPVFGLDNWVYMGNGPGSDEGEIYYPGKPDGPRLPDNASGHIVRFRPDSKELEMSSSRTQFGHTFDAWGYHFLVENSNHIYQEVIAAPYLNRNPGLLVSDATQSLSDHGDAAEVYPITKNPEHQLLTDVGVFTSACSITSYEGGLFPPVFDSIIFVTEPVSNMVHADLMKNKGASFTASRMYPHKEFLASTDAWFRPVNMYIGPDGALYVVDYYRQIIEGPEWMAEEVVKSGNLYNGTDKGRIYRITPTGTEPATWTKQLALGGATDAQLVEKLADPNIWWRRNAQRLLVDRNSKQALPALKKMAQNTTAPLGRLHALWTLEGLHALTTDLITQALQDPEPGIRKNAVKLAELHLETSPSLSEAMLGLQGDTDPKVRYQLLCSLGFIDTPQAAQVRQQLLFKDISDPWVQIAALSAPSSQNAGLLASVLGRYEADNAAYGSLVQRLSAMIATSEGVEEIHQLLQRATTGVSGKAGEWQAYVLEGLARGLKSRKSLPSQLQAERSLLVRAFLKNPSAQFRQASLHMLQVIGLPEGTQTKAAMQKARQMAGDERLPAEQRATALEFLALKNPEPYASLLKDLIVPHEPLPVQLAALETLSAIPNLTVSHYVLQQWEALTPEVRDAALNTFMVYPFNLARIRLLLDAIEDGNIQQASLGWSRSVILMRDIPDSLKNRARFLLTKEDGQRQEIIKQYQSALDLTADKVQGEAVFQRNCTTCHQIGGAGGKAFGPDLSTVRNWLPENLIVNILDPSISIANGYDLWAVELKTGEVKQGIISSETPSAITLHYPGGEEVIIARQDVQSLRALNMSAMPPGLEKQITQQEMADLLAYLKKN